MSCDMETPDEGAEGCFHRWKETNTISRFAVVKKKDWKLWQEQN